MIGPAIVFGLKGKEMWTLSHSLINYSTYNELQEAVFVGLINWHSQVETYCSHQSIGGRLRKSIDSCVGDIE